MRKYMRKLGRITLVLASIVMIAAVIGAIYSICVLQGITDNLVRLHVIANSDCEEDQALKLKVRDSVVEYTDSLLSGVGSASESLELLREHTQDIQQVAKQRLEEEGSEYDVSVYTGDFAFPAKNYGDITLPAGTYQSLRVVIGEGSGANWWCVLFPPLCFVNAGYDHADAPALEEVLPGESYEIIQTDPKEDTVKIRFKIVEFFEESVQKIQAVWTSWFG